jgi:hypothetical protein
VEIFSSDRKCADNSDPDVAARALYGETAERCRKCKVEQEEEFQMGKLIHFPDVESADCVPAEEQIDNGLIGMEFRDAVACLHGIIELSPRTAHQIMKKIVGVYRSLVTIADGELE